MQLSWCAVLCVVWGVVCGALVRWCVLWCDVMMSALQKDTLARGKADLIVGGSGSLHLLSVGELCEQPCLKILPPLVLFPPVDKHLILHNTSTKPDLKKKNTTTQTYTNTLMLANKWPGTDQKTDLKTILTNQS